MQRLSVTVKYLRESARACARAEGDRESVSESNCARASACARTQCFVCAHVACVHAVWVCAVIVLLPGHLYNKNTRHDSS